MLAVCDNFAPVVFNAKKSKNSTHTLLVLVHLPLPQFLVGGNDTEFVDEWPHLKHIITTVHDDKTDIISKQNILCGHINNVLCFFGKRDPITKLSLLKAYCSSFYGSVMWDLSHSSIDAFCAIWRNGLRHVWNLPHNTHCALLPLLSGLLRLMDELARWCATFINGCLDSDCDVVDFVTRHSVCSRKMLSPIVLQRCGRSSPPNTIYTVRW